MSREDQKQSVIEGPQESEAMADHGAKGEEIYIEHVPGNATELHGDGNLVMEYQISEGITRETILAFVVCSLRHIGSPPIQLFSNSRGRQFVVS